MKHGKFVISRFNNRNGVISWRVDGSIQGVRIRRNFKSREEAAVQKSVLEIRAALTAAGLRQTMTFLAITSCVKPKTPSAVSRATLWRTR